MHGLVSHPEMHRPRPVLFRARRSLSLSLSLSREEGKAGKWESAITNLIIDEKGAAESSFARDLSKYSQRDPTRCEMPHGSSSLSSQLDRERIRACVASEGNAAKMCRKTKRCVRVGITRCARAAVDKRVCHQIIRINSQDVDLTV